MADTVQTWSPNEHWSPALSPASGCSRPQPKPEAFPAAAIDHRLPDVPAAAGSIIVGLIVYPAFYSIYLSMLNKAQTRFIGLGNFSFLLSRDVFRMVVEQTAIFALSPCSSKR